MNKKDELLADTLLSFCQVLLSSGLTDVQAQVLARSPLFDDFLKAKLDGINRDQFRAVCGLHPLRASGFPVWKKVMCGTGLKSVEDFLSEFKSKGIVIDKWVPRLIENKFFKVQEHQTEVCLANVSPRELGFRSSWNIGQFYQKAKEMGFELCPFEVGPQLRLQYLDQSAHEPVHVTMPPVADAGNWIHYFYLSRIAEEDGTLSLDDIYDTLDSTFDPDVRFIFKVP